MLKKIFTLGMVYLAMHASYAQNLITNGSFEQTTNWLNLAGDGGSATYTFLSTDAVDGTTSLRTDVTTLGTNFWSIQSIHSGWTATPGTPYTLSFYAKAAGTPASLKSVMQSTNSNYYAEKTYALTTDWVKYEWTFTPTEAAEQLKFNYLTAGGVYYIDNVQVVDPSATGPLTLTIDKSTSYQQMTGFGGALTWYCDRIISSPKKTEIADLLFSDLGTDIIRLKNWYYPDGYPAVKSPAEMETDWFKPHFDATNQLYTLAKQENENIDVLLSSWGPPSALKSNDNLNEGTLKSSNGQFMYAEFGQYWTDLLDNITFTPEYISIQNEPGFETPDWASCAFRPVETATVAGYDQAFDAVYDQIKNRTTVPKMIGPETENIGSALWDASLNTFREFATPIKNKSALEAYAYHLYNYYGSPGSIDATPLNMIKTEFNNKPNFMTEFSSANFDWLQTADIIQESLLQANASAYIYWEMMWDETKADAMINVDASGNYTIGDHYYTIKHFAKYIDKGYTRIALTGNNALTKSSAFINPAGTQITIVSVNNSSDPQDINLGFGSATVSGVTAYQSVDGDFYQTVTVDASQAITLPEKSITTFVVTLTNSCAVATISTTESTALCTGESVDLTASSGSSYKWFSGSSQVGTSQTYAASAAGSYTVEVTSASGCKSTSSPTVVTTRDASECTTTATTDALITGSIILAPNPSNDVFSLTLSQVSDVQILTVDGRLLDFFSSTEQLSFGATYAKGIYIVKVNSGTKTDVLRVVKQ